jgi:hypothetical protein
MDSSHGNAIVTPTPRKKVRRESFSRIASIDFRIRFFQFFAKSREARLFRN